MLEPLGVVAGGDEQRGRAVGADAVLLEQGRGGGLNQVGDPGGELGDLRSRFFTRRPSTAVTVAATHARFALGGSLDAQQGKARWPQLDIAAAIEKNLVLRGFSPLHDVHAFTEWPLLFSRWLREGLVYPHTVVNGGVEALPQTMLGLVAGRFRGQVAVHLVAS